MQYKKGVIYGTGSNAELHDKSEHETMSKLLADNKPLKMYIHWSPPG